MSVSLIVESIQFLFLSYGGHMWHNMSCRALVIG